MPEPEATAKQFKIGSKLSDLDRQLGDWQPSSSEVTKSTPSSEPKGGGQANRVLKTRIGDIGENFQGTITLYHHSWVIPDDIKPSFMIELTYVNGTLNDVQYGILPG